MFNKKIIYYDLSNDNYYYFKEKCSYKKEI